MANGLVRRIRALFQRDKLEHELDEELRFHLEKEAERFRALGMSEADARRAARKSFGGAVDGFKEEARDARGVRLLEETWQDLRFGARTLRKTPAFTAVAVLSLALGIGANTALFSVVDAVLLDRLPVHDPGALVVFEWQAGRAFRNSGTSGYGTRDLPPGRRGSSSFHPRIYDALKGRNQYLTGLAAFSNIWDLTLVVDGVGERCDGQFVSGNYFDVVGVQPALGRSIEPTDDLPSAEPVAVLSYETWRDRFHSDPAALGAKIEINNVPFTVVGVAPAGFRGTLQVDSDPKVHVPISAEALVDSGSEMSPHADEPGLWFEHLIGRLASGATIVTARDDLRGAFQATALEIMPAAKKAGESNEIQPSDMPVLEARDGSRGLTETRRNYAPMLYFLFGVVGLVLLIACANVANMMLARSTSRGSEIGVRLALGAGRVRLVRQLLTESLLLALAGGALGIVVAAGGTNLLVALGASDARFLPADVAYGISWRVLLFSLAVSTFTGLLFGLVPAWRAAKYDLLKPLKEGSRGSRGPARSRLSKSLVVVQVATSLVLLLGAGLLVRSVANLQKVDAGFDERGLLDFTIQPGLAGYKDDRMVAFVEQLAPKLESLPGVRATTFTKIPMIADFVNDQNVILPGETANDATEHDTNRNAVRENFFESMGIPIVRGRGFTEHDSATAPLVAVVSEEFVHRFMPDKDPIGQRIGFDDETVGKIEIVGVARDIKYSNKRDDFAPLTYTPWQQDLDAMGRTTWMLRVDHDPGSLESAVRQAVKEVDSTLPVTGIQTQVEQSRKTFATERALANLLTLFGALALVLATIGLYGVLAYSVAQRTNEIGIRMALGARAGGVLRLVVWQGLTYALVGLGVGALAALGLKRLVESQLFGLGATDPVTFVSVASALLLAAFVACLIPARRATKVDPVVALRSE